MSGKIPKYTPEFKQTIVNLYHSGKTYAQINQEYGIFLDYSQYLFRK